MFVVHNIFGISIMSLILAFSAIHLGVGIGIIAPDRSYSDIFRPQIGLASFNLVISILGLATGVLGMLCVLKNADQLGRIVVLISSVLALFTIASLITALVINSKSLSYLGTRVSNHIAQYKSSEQSSEIIDRIQMNHECCGDDLWIDWTSAELTVTSPTVSSTTSISSTNTTTSNTETTTTPSTTSLSTTTPTTTSVAITVSTSADVGRVARGIQVADSNLIDDSHPQLFHSARHVRQTVPNYSTIPNLPLSFGVTLPGSCCMSGAVFTNDSSNSYCLSNANGTENRFYTKGCTKYLDVIAGNQAMGIGVINCFMLVLALVAIPILLIRPDL